MEHEERKADFDALADDAAGLCRPDETVLCEYAGEASDFVRINRAKIRQAGRVFQAALAITLIQGDRQARMTTGLSADAERDRKAVREAMGQLREMIRQLSADPYLLHADEVHSSERREADRLPPAETAVEAVIGSAGGADLVGIYASGSIFRGFANSLGQRNWFESRSWNLDWSLYHEKDKAVKSSLSGRQWDPAALRERMELASAQLKMLAVPSRTIPPGRYRVFLAPAALREIVRVLCWRGFGLKSHRTKTTSLIKMTEENRTLHPGVHMAENTAQGTAPDFSSEGFIKPGRVELIQGGRYTDCLISPRSGKEYAAAHTAANEMEFPESFELAAGDIPMNAVLEKLGNGIYINNLWYLNYSDVPACRMTGMTRFACFMVENGEIVAPVNVMRFDESIYRILGENLMGLTRERDFILSPSTYGGRSTESVRLPGALVGDFVFTL